jgi:hypothetical protein
VETPQPAADERQRRPRLRRQLVEHSPDRLELLQPLAVGEVFGDEHLAVELALHLAPLQQDPPPRAIGLPELGLMRCNLARAGRVLPLFWVQEKLRDRPPAEGGTLDAEEAARRRVRVDDASGCVGDDDQVGDTRRDLGQRVVDEQALEDAVDLADDRLQGALLLIRERVLRHVLDVEQPLDPAADSDRQAELGTELGRAVDPQVEGCQWVLLRVGHVGHVDALARPVDVAEETLIEVLRVVPRQAVHALTDVRLRRQPELPPRLVNREDRDVLPIVVVRELPDDHLGDAKAALAARDLAQQLVAEPLLLLIAVVEGHMHRAVDRQRLQASAVLVVVGCGPPTEERDDGDGFAEGDRVADERLESLRDQRLEVGVVPELLHLRPPDEGLEVPDRLGIDFAPHPTRESGRDRVPARNPTDDSGRIVRQPPHVPQVAAQQRHDEEVEGDDPGDDPSRLVE